jgi:hypothetical protein
MAFMSARAVGIRSPKVSPSVRYSTSAM